MGRDTLADSILTYGIVIETPCDICWHLLIERLQDLQTTTETLETIAARAIPTKRFKSSKGDKSSSDKEQGSSDDGDLGLVANYARAHRSVVVSKRDLQEVNIKFLSEDMDSHNEGHFKEDLQAAANGAFDRILGTKDHKLTMTPVEGYNEYRRTIILALHSTDQYFHSSKGFDELVAFKEIPLVTMDPDTKKTIDENISKVLTACGLITTKFHTPNWVMLTALKEF
ncbi:hypothetical protein IV203_014696 [Nitzschia inconspicua]|uniref:Uncharacterized protein n=1 Tax=Nitzschia inconspicua TaxID=303405 RepID=A0A9K3PUY8_9STRA|nr:hypothetical protein IV203_014696 [Nitzschia inconspicua]